MEEAEYRQLVYEQFSSLTVANSALVRAVTAIHLGEKEKVVGALQEAMAELSEAFERLGRLAGRGE